MGGHKNKTKNKSKNKNKNKNQKNPKKQPENGMDKIETGKVEEKDANGIRNSQS